MIHDMRQNFIHQEAKKIRGINPDLNTPQSFDVVKKILDRYDQVNDAKLNHNNCNIPLVMLSDFMVFSDKWGIFNPAGDGLWWRFVDKAEDKETRTTLEMLLEFYKTH